MPSLVRAKNIRVLFCAHAIRSYMYVTQYLCGIGHFLPGVLTILVTPPFDPDEQSYSATTMNGSVKARAPSIPTSALSSVKGSQDPRRP